MSGGSWDYVYYKMQEAADRLRSSDDAQRRVFGELMHLCAEAMHDIEWVDSCDKAKGDEVAAINRALCFVCAEEAALKYQIAEEALTKAVSDLSKAMVTIDPDDNL